MQDDNIYYNNYDNIINNDKYKYCKLSNNPNDFQEMVKLESSFEDLGIYEKKKDKEDNIIMGNGNNIKNENNIDNDKKYNISDIERDYLNEEKTEEYSFYQTKIRDINKKNNHKNREYNKEKFGNNDLMIKEDENIKNRGMSEKEY